MNKNVFSVNTAEKVVVAWCDLRRENWEAHPMVQIPLLFTAVNAVSLLDQPSMTTGGIFWFPDLTACALKWTDGISVLMHPDAPLTLEEVQALRTSITPMGAFGPLLPTALFMTLSSNFSSTIRAGHSLTLEAFGGADDPDAQEGVERTVVRNPICGDRDIRSGPIFDLSAWGCLDSLQRLDILSRANERMLARAHMMLNVRSTTVLPSEYRVMCLLFAKKAT
jgi:hypothetical protein